MRRLKRGCSCLTKVRSVRCHVHCPITSCSSPIKPRYKPKRVTKNNALKVLLKAAYYPVCPSLWHSTRRCYVDGQYSGYLALPAATFSCVWTRTIPPPSVSGPCTPISMQCAYKRLKPKHDSAVQRQCNDSRRTHSMHSSRKGVEGYSSLTALNSNKGKWLKARRPGID